MSAPDPTLVGAQPALMDAVARMFAANARRRADRANRAVNLLRPYERRILREAAVMGYILGHRHGQSRPRERDDAFPHAADIVMQVVQHCDGDGGYPYLADACNGQRRRITKKRMWPGELTDDSKVALRAASTDRRPNRTEVNE